MIFCNFNFIHRNISLWPSISYVGFHLAPIDLRQHSKIHSKALEEVFSHIGLPLLSDLTEEKKKELLLKELLNSRPLGTKSYLQLCGSDTQELFETLKVARSSIDLFSGRAIEAYIISMTKDEIDILLNEAVSPSSSKMSSSFC